MKRHSLRSFTLTLFGAGIAHVNGALVVEGVGVMSRGGSLAANEELVGARFASFHSTRLF